MSGYSPVPICATLCRLSGRLYSTGFAPKAFSVGMMAGNVGVEPNVGDDVLVELLGRAAERYEGDLTAFGPPDFQLRIALVAGANHVPVSFKDAELEKARKQPRQPPQRRRRNKAGLRVYYRAEPPNEIGFPMSPFDRLGAPGGCRRVHVRWFASRRQQSLLIASNGTENLVLAITPEQRQHLAGAAATRYHPDNFVWRDDSYPCSRIGAMSKRSILAGVSNSNG